MPPFSVTRGGIPIEQVSLRNASEFANAGISYSLEFEAWEAATTAGLDMWRWEKDRYPRPFKMRVLAWHRLHNLVALHQQDAGVSKSKQKRR